MIPSTGEQMTDTEALAAVLAEDAATRAGEHPELDELAGYLARDLVPETEARIQDHLVACRPCTTKLLDLETLSRPGPETAEGVTDLATIAAWREQKSRIAELEAARRRQRWVSAVAASFFVATIGLTAHVGQLRRTIAGLEAPELNPQTVYLDASALRSGGSKTIELGPDTKSLTLSFTPATDESWTDYEVQILRTSGTEVWSGRGLELSGYGSLDLRVPRALLPAGTYQVRLHGLEGDRREQLLAAEVVVRDE